MTEIGKLNDVCNVVSCSNNEAITLTTYDYKQCKVDKKKNVTLLSFQCSWMRLSDYCHFSFTCNLKLHFSINTE